MIQIDTAGKVYVVGKNPHLVTITPERKDQILQVNDILSIGRRDREPWMRFQVVKYTNNNSANGSVAQASTASAGKVANRNGSSSAAASSNVAPKYDMRSPPNKKQKITTKKQANLSSKEDSSGNNKSNVDRSSSNLSSGLSRSNEAQKPKAVARPSAQPSPQIQKQPQQQRQQQAHQQRGQQQRKQPQNAGNMESNSHHDGQLPEWITTTTGKRSRGNKSPSSLSAAQGTNSKQQQHQAIVARLTKAAAAAIASRNPAVAASVPPNAEAAAAAALTHSQKHHESDSNAAQRKRRRRMSSALNRDSSINNNNNSAGGVFKAIRSAEDLFNGSRPHHPQIHLVFQDYETSAKLVNATQRKRPIDDISGDSSEMRHPRTDRNFISKPDEGPARNGRGGPISPRTTESGGDEQPEQLGLLTQNFAAALLGVASPTPAEANSRRSIPPVVVDGEKVVVQGEAARDQELQQKKEDQKEEMAMSKEKGAEEQDGQVTIAARGENRARPSSIQRIDSATCRAALAKYTAEKEAAARRKEAPTQSQGEKTSELEDDVRNNASEKKSAKANETATGVAREDDDGQDEGGNERLK